VPGARVELASTRDDGCLSAVSAWLARGLPLVGARGDPAQPALVALGLACPPGAPVRRIALQVPRNAIARVAPPPLLRDAARSAPAAWRDPLRALDAEARRAGLTLRVHGSLAWQHLSGDGFVTEGSDGDLLVRPRDLAALARALVLLTRRAAGPPRLDGEVLLPGGRAVAWRELAGGAARVLVKSSDAVALEPRARVMAWLGPPASAGAGG
jgi:phosphoribosyl-dephospho-CoA transferase